MKIGGVASKPICYASTCSSPAAFRLYPHAKILIIFILPVFIIRGFAAPVKAALSTSKIPAIRVSLESERYFSPWELTTALAWSPKGDLLAVAAGEKVFIFRAASMQAIVSLRLGAFTHSLAFNRDGRWLAAGSRDGKVRVWEVNQLMDDSVPGATVNWQPLLSLNAHKKGVNSVSFSPDGRWLASGGNDAIARIWELPAGKLTAEIIGGSFAVPAVVFTVDGHSLAILNGNTIRLREIPSGRIQGSFRAQAPLYSLGFSPDGRQLAAGDSANHILIWDPAKAFRAGSTQYPLPHILTGHFGRSASYSSLIWRVQYSPNGNLLASAGGDGSLRLWDPVSGESLFTFQGPVEGMSCVEFSPDGTRLAAGGLDGSLRVWRLSNP